VLEFWGLGSITLIAVLLFWQSHHRHRFFNIRKVQLQTSYSRAIGKYFTVMQLVHQAQYISGWRTAGPCLRPTRLT